MNNGSNGNGSEPNSSDFNPEEWVVALAYGKTFLGKFVGRSLQTRTSDALDPCYELTLVTIPIPQQVKQPDGSVAMNIQIQSTRTVGPIGNFPSWRSLLLPDDALVRLVSEFSTSEQTMLARHVADIEAAFAQQEKQERAAALALQVSQTKAFGGGARED